MNKKNKRDKRLLDAIIVNGAKAAEAMARSINDFEREWWQTSEPCLKGTLVGGI